MKGARSKTTPDLDAAARAAETAQTDYGGCTGDGTGEDGTAVARAAAEWLGGLDKVLLHTQHALEDAR